MDLYNRMMTAEFACELLNEKEYIFLYANPQKGEKGIIEKRGTRAKEVLTPKKCYKVEYFGKGFSKEKKIEEGFRSIGINNEIDEYASLEKEDMYIFLEKLFNQSKILLVDFTLMNTRFLGSFFSFLYLFNWEEVYFCYTEPGMYNKNDRDNFELRNTTMGFDQIPGLETSSDSATECDWIVFLGFEGSRMMRLQEEAPASRRYSLPYISIPAMKTSWHDTALDANMEFLKLKINKRESINYVSAVNPFETYRSLTHLKKTNSNVRLVVSPVGPKPVMLGCIMYVLENEDEMLLFDNPFQEGNNTEEYGLSHFYDLSQFVKSVKNKRYSEEE